MILRRRPRSVPERTPHPDPRVEQQLQHILTLRRLIASAEEQLRLYLDEIKSAQNQWSDYLNRYSRGTYYGTLSIAERASQNRLKAAETQIEKIRSDIRGLQGEVTQELSILGDNDVAYL